MKCPKCHYLSFEPEPRCRNCGYDLELVDSDLALREFESEETLAPIADLRLRDPEPDWLGAAAEFPSEVPVRAVRAGSDTPGLAMVLD